MIALWTRAKDFYRRTQILSDDMMFLFLLLFCMCCVLFGVCCCCKQRTDDYDEDALAEWQRLDDGGWALMVVEPRLKVAT